jgi:hypothetical protein
MLRRLPAIVGLAFLIAVPAAAQSGSSQPGGSQPSYRRIVIPADCHPAVRSAARILAHSLAIPESDIKTVSAPRLPSGGEIVLATAQGSPGSLAQRQALGPDAKPIRHDGYMIVFRGGGALIFGNRPRSLLYAAGDWRLWKERASGTFLREPDFALRNRALASQCRDADVPLYAFLYGNDFNSWSPALYAAAVKAYPSVKGTPAPASFEKAFLCPSDPMTWKIIRAYVQDFMEQSGADGLYATFWDRYGLYCQDDRCLRTGLNRFPDELYECVKQAGELATRFGWLKEFAICSRYLDESLWRYQYLRHLASMLTTDPEQLKYLAEAYDAVKQHEPLLFQFDSAQKFSCYDTTLGQLRIRPSLGTPLPLMKELYEKSKAAVEGIVGPDYRPPS